MPYALTLLHLYPDAMNLYGDRGNVLALYQRMQWRGLELIIHRASAGPWQAGWNSADLVFMGGGQDAQQEGVIEDMHRHKAEGLRQLHSEGAQFITICGGYQFMGAYYKPHAGPELKGLALLDAHTIASHTRMIGNVALECIIEGETQSLVGFENHSGKTYLGAGVTPLGKVIIGHGNNGEDGLEGAWHENILGTYLHGSLLPKNPWLTDALLKRALLRKHGHQALEAFPPLEDAMAQRAHHEALQVAKSKQNR